MYASNVTLHLEREREGERDIGNIEFKKTTIAPLLFQVFSSLSFCSKFIPSNF